MKRFVLFLAIFCCVTSVAQAAAKLDACQPLIAAAEQAPNESVYLECGFGDFKTAAGYWAPLAEKNGWKAALYEIYRHNATYPVTQKYLNKSAQLGYMPALVVAGDELYEQGKIPEAMKYYNVAIRGDLDEATKGKITGRVAFLYANPKGPYHDTKKAVPLLKKAATQRDALSNNILGALSLVQEDAMAYNAEEAFKYFWRAILLGCTAAQENLGFFLLAKDHKIDNATMQQEILARAYSCDSVAKTSVNYPLYHLTFTQQQCADINYYAERLVDPSLPFTGKKECAFSSDMAEITNFLAE